LPALKRSENRSASRASTQPTKTTTHGGQLKLRLKARGDRVQGRSGSNSATPAKKIILPDHSIVCTAVAAHNDDMLMLFTRTIDSKGNVANTAIAPITQELQRRLETLMK